MKNFYVILGVEKGASQEDIKKAYRKLAVQYHPDKNPDDKQAEERFKSISEAYDILGDEEKRAKYDKIGHGSRYSRYDPSFDFMKDTVFSQGWSQAFNDIYGGNGVKKGPDAIAMVTLTIKEAYTGTSKDVTVNGKTYKINIKKGVESNQKLRIRGLGHPHPFNSELNKGDLIIIPTVLLDERFVRRGADLFIDIPVHIYTLLAGGVIEIPTPEGSLMQTVSPMINGTITIPNCGMPYYDSERKGNIIAKINPLFPKDVTADEMHLIQQLKAYEK